MNNASLTCPSTNTLPTVPEILIQDCPVDWLGTPLPFQLFHSQCYNATDRLRFAWMRNLPRFGFPNDLSDDWQSYVNGLASFAIFTSVLFIVWWTVLIFFKIRGKGGFLSGTLTRRQSTQIRICRYTVCFCGILVWIFSVLLITKALKSLKDVIDLAQETIPLAGEILDEAGNATTAYVQATVESREARIAFLDNLTEYCDLVGSTEDAVVQLNETLTSVSKVGDRLHDISESIVDTQGLLDMVDGYLDITREALVYVVIIAVILIDLMVWVFLAATVLRWRTEQYHQNHNEQAEPSSNPLQAIATLEKLNGCLVPTFAFMLVGTYVFSIVSMMTSEMISDLCVPLGDVNEKMKTLIGLPPVHTDLIGWYVGGCISDDRPGYIPNMLNQVVVPSVQEVLSFGKNWLTGEMDDGGAGDEGDTLFNETASNMGNGVTDVEDAATEAVGGTEDMVNLTSVFETVTETVVSAQELVQCGLNVQAVQKSWTHLQAKLVNVLHLGLEMIKALDCRRVHTVYHRLLHELTCKQGLTAMGQSFLWLFLLTFFAMIMFTCRAAWNPISMAEAQGKDSAISDSKQQLGPEEVSGVENRQQDPSAGAGSMNYDNTDIFASDTNKTLESSGAGINAITLAFGEMEEEGEEVVVWYKKVSSQHCR